MILVITTLPLEKVKKNKNYSNFKFLDTKEIWDSLYQEWQNIIKDEHRLKFLINVEISTKLKSSIKNSKNGLFYKISEKYEEETINNIFNFIDDKCNNVECVKIYDFEKKINKLHKKTIKKFCDVEFYES